MSEATADLLAELRTARERILEIEATGNRLMALLHVRSITIDQLSSSRFQVCITEGRFEGETLLVALNAAIEASCE